MPRTKALGLAAAATALTLGLAACGGGGGEGGGDQEPLQFGYIFPETGDLSHLGPPQISAAKYAHSEINKAGGVLGKELPGVLTGDEANDAAQAVEAADGLLDKDVDAVLGAAASGMTMAIIDKITKEKVVQCSGSNTAPDLTDYDDGGFYFRTAPSDLLQGPVLADTVAADGHQSVAIVHRADDYGDGLAEATKTGLEDAGIEVKATESYDPNSPNFGSVVDAVKDAKAEAVVMVSFEEGVQIITGLIEAGVKTDTMYATDGLSDETLAGKVDKDKPETLKGFSGTAPAVDNKKFQEDLTAYDDKLEVFQYAPQVYDCAISIALAAEAAESTDPAVFVKELPKVTKDGEECTGFEQCRDLIKDGKDVDYTGASGPIDFDENGDVAAASIGIYEFGDKGKLDWVDYVETKPES
ncbi:amino acid/amide ABC transporter substrate-binding protein (HAAT family) [Murinocardiopsis flavida]|uniref:Amino acid/amide ABC transporter substrate-binding protein (HAAT family) n=1 Tax=Murinocardiopsis flavida TaxID=645275 RepID=A0A2P8CNL8_9ACTN|nr:ABC transporter substrate-binding protein [Murinocardiopsis flavida]PSK86530.1 amino acid/amide ABC transporter substrate-binding protein (HAAT family) [Murinocardiopsis flavida]